MPFPLEYVSDGDWDVLRRNTDQTAARLNPVLPQARVYNSANLSIATATLTALTFNNERYDNGSLHDTGSNTSRLTAPITGLYSIGAAVEFAANATGMRQLAIKLNGAISGATYIAIIATPTVGAGMGTQLTIETQYQLAAGDYVEAFVQQTSGGNLNVSALGNYSPEFWMHRVGGYVNMGV